MEGELELVLSAHPEGGGGWGSQARRDFIAGKGQARRRRRRRRRRRLLIARLGRGQRRRAFTSRQAKARSPTAPIRNPRPAGAVGGMAGVVAGAPLDTLRIRLQQRDCAARTVAGAWAAMRAGAEGVRGLFRGMSYPLYTTALQNAVTFQAQRAGERALAAAGAQPGLGETCGAGMFAGARAAGGAPAPAPAPPRSVPCCGPRYRAPPDGRPLRPTGRGAPAAVVNCPEPPRPPSSLRAPPLPPQKGAVQTLISSPVELLKIRLQLQRAPPGAAGYAGPLRMLRRVLAEEVGAGRAAFGGSFWPRVWPHRVPRGAWRAVLLARVIATAGAFGGGGLWACDAPAHPPRGRALTEGPPPTPIGVVRPPQQGGAGLLRGCGVTMLRDTPSYGFYFVIYAAACSGLSSLARGGAGAPAPGAAAEAPAAGRCGGGAGSSGGAGVAGSGGGSGSESSAGERRSSGGSGGTSTSGTNSSTSSGGGGGGGEAGGGAGAAVQLLAGGLAGMLAWLSVYPLDVVKSRIQAQPAAASRYRGAWVSVRSAWQSGAGRPYSGPGWALVAPGVALAPSGLGHRCATPPPPPAALSKAKRGRPTPLGRPPPLARLHVDRAGLCRAVLQGGGRRRVRPRPGAHAEPRLRRQRRHLCVLRGSDCGYGRRRPPGGCSRGLTEARREAPPRRLRREALRAPPRPTPN